MKKIAVLFALAALTALAGCPTPTEANCLAAAECTGEADPVAFCTDLKADCEADTDVCKKISDACTVESDANQACIAAAGPVCVDEVFGADAAAACETEGAAVAECATAALAE